MAALVQTFPSQTAVNMLPRPGSADRYTTQGRHTHKQSNSSNTGYRGSSGPVPAYSFTSTPQLSTSTPRQLASHSAHQRASSSSSNVPQLPLLNLGSPNAGQRSTATFASFTATAQDNPSSLSPPAAVASTAVKPSPDRYRRNVRRTDSSENTSRTSTVGQSIYNHPGQSSSSPSLNSYQSYRGTTYTPGAQTRATSSDDLQIERQGPELASRYRRRSLGNIEVAGLNHTGDAQDMSSPHPNSFVQSAGDYMTAQPLKRPVSSHGHSGSTDSMNSARSNRSSRPTSARNDSSAPSTPPTGSPNHSGNFKPENRTLNVPARPNDVGRRVPSPLSNPSPLSRPATAGVPPHRPITPQISSPAAEHLAALNQKDQKKSKSKLRRAFSFGSAAELRKATAQANHEKSKTTAGKRTSKYEGELEPEQARIAEKQEAAGLGESIYSGQGNFFTGSTDNLSISSTASSASIMLRKMGNGVKKGTRSLVGLFRPKSVLGVPAADGPVNRASAAQVSMVTVEAEREKVNVNLDPHDQAGGGTAFPKLERNSLENKISLDSGSLSHDSRSRRSIVGGERERAEVLAAVKKGILKRTDSGQSSPSLRPTDGRTVDLTLPGIPNVNDSPRSSAPSTPGDEPPRSGHRRTDSVTIENDDNNDYFASVTRYASMDSKTAAALSPQAAMRNISFSPRIQFHDTWPSGEYDRRGEIATCNRLTPMLAQQIKEELNTFKMEMEVHESSKIYTHFF